MFTKLRSLLFSDQDEAESKMEKITSNSSSKNPVSVTINDDKPSYALKGKNLDIYVNGGRLGHGNSRSRVKLRNIVDYKWEMRKYPGRLIAVHRDGDVIAYSIQLKSGVAMVRVVWNGERALIKGMSVEALDIQFAHMSSPILLACIDRTSLHVYRVATEPGKLDTAFLLVIRHTVEGATSHRINWCPFVPSSKEEDDDANQLLVWVQGDTFQCVNVNSVVESYGSETHDYADLLEGVVQHKESSAVVTAVTFSPDGTTLGVGFDDGNVYFYQVYLHEPTPRRLFQWRPHENKPVTTLAFLDDHTIRVAANRSFWKHALTATDNNTEIKLWRCDNWTCIQRICFKPTVFDSYFDFKLDIDATSSYLVLSEQYNRVLYAIQIEKDETEAIDSDDEEAKKDNSFKANHSLVAFKTIAEFQLSSPILSFNIARANKGKFNCDRLEDDVDDFEEEADPMFGVMIKMFLVQPKSVQECQMFFQTENASVPEIQGGDAATTPQNEHQLESIVEVAAATTPSSSQRQKSSAQINLMTPESFQSPSGKESPVQVFNSAMAMIRMIAAATSPEQQKVNIDSMLSYASIEEQQLRAMAVSSSDPSSNPVASSTVISSEIPPSGSSSPSREVQEILSLKDELFEDLPSSHLTMDEELEANSSGGGDNGVNDRPESDETRPEDDVTQLNMTQSKILDDINSIKMFVDDDEDNEVARDGPLLVNRDWPNAPNILPDMVRIEKKPPPQQTTSRLSNGENNFNLNNLSSTSTASTAAVAAAASLSMESKLDRILDMLSENNAKMDKLERRMTQWEEGGGLFMELQPHLMALVSRELENIKGMIQYEVANKLSTSDKLLQENLSYVCSNKNLMEAFAAAIRSGVQHTVQVTFQEQVNNLIIPAYERASKEMFKQTNQMFQKGVANYSKQVHTYMTQFQPVYKQNEKLSKTMKELPEQFKVTNEKVINSFSAQIIHEVNKDFKTMQLNILKLIKESVKQEVSKGFESQVANLEDSVLSAVRSQAQTPSVFDIQEQIRNLLNQGQVNKAFHQALISNDLALVEFTLEKADIKTVFNPCQLEPTVLLSLIQQLSADMNAYSTAKHQYLSEAITSLNLSDTVIREHAPKILKQLSRSLHKYMEDHPNGPFWSRIKMLLMMIQGLSTHFSS